MRCACIDIGSNTTRLLLADCRDGVPVEVVQERAFTRIGASLEADGMIPADKIAEVAATVARQAALAERLGARRLRAVATAAIRRATNRAALVAAVAEACPVSVEVLTEADEARLAFTGAARTLDRPPAGELAVIDVGGGSSELAIGTAPDRVRWSLSLPVGSSDLAHRCFAADPPTVADVAVARARMASLLNGVEVPRPVEAIAVGGSATSLRRLAGEVLDGPALRRGIDQLCGAPSAVLAAAIGLDPQRVRLLPAGLVILEAVADRLGVAPRVGNGGIREGVVLELADAG